MHKYGVTARAWSRMCVPVWPPPRPPGDTSSAPPPPKSPLCPFPLRAGLISASSHALCKAGVILLLSVTSAFHALPYLPVYPTHTHPTLFSSCSSSPAPSAARSPSPYQRKHKSQNEGGGPGSWGVLLCAFLSGSSLFPWDSLLPRYFSWGGLKEIWDTRWYWGNGKWDHS